MTDIEKALIDEKIKNTAEIFDTRCKGLEEKIADNAHDIGHLYTRMGKVENTQTRQDTTMENILVELGRLREAIEGFQKKPAKRWEKFIMASIASIGSAVGVAMITLLAYMIIELT